MRLRCLSVSQRNTQLIVLFWKLLQFVYKLNKTLQILAINRTIKPIDGIIDGIAIKMPESRNTEHYVFCPIIVQLNGAHVCSDIYIHKRNGLVLINIYNCCNFPLLRNHIKRN